MPHVISPSEPVPPVVQGIQISIDRGGTFTDCIGTNIPGKDDVVVKLLSVDPSNYKDAPTEGIRRILEYATGQKLGRGELIDTTPIASIKMGTTVATNALLERSSEPCGLVVSRGFKDLLRIGDQTRPKLFDLNIRRAAPLFSKVLEIDERVTQEEYSENPYPKAASELDQLVDDVNVVKGVGGELIRILEPLDAERARIGLQALFDDGVRSLAVILLHSYTFPQHELEIGRLAREIGFTQISLSSQLLPMIKAVSRGHSAAADAYLTPVVQNYIESFRSGFVGKLEDDSTSTRCEFMQSDGGLVGWQRFNGLRAILSGPAGGVVGFSRTCYDEDTKTPVIGFDMGGTSTDCTRYDGILTHTLETVISGVTIQSPQLEINTVAAGGGSILTYRNGLFKAGPQSAGAHPGPCCYRKGGPLCVTDANLILGRLSPDHFPKIFGPNEDAPLDLAASRAAFEKMTEEINADLEKTGGKKLSVEEVALGFLDVANESMCRPIRQLTESKGFNSGDHNLASFGGAGGQHACAIADRLKIKRVIIHKHASILSAYGMGLADTVQEAHSPFSGVYASSIKEIAQRLDALQDQVESQLKSEGFGNEDIEFERYVNLRYAGSDTVIMILKPADEDYAKAFIKEHQREFSFTLNREVLVENLRVRGRANKGIEAMRQAKTITTELSELVKKPISISSDLEHLRVYFEGGWQESPLFLLKDQTPGDVISGPAMIHDATQMIVVQPGAKATILKDHIIIDLKDEAPRSDAIVTDASTIVEDPVQLSIMSNRFMGIAEQMGLTLQRTSVSVNIKERLDFSCALFGPTGGLVANAPHVPVHLGSMEHAVRFQHELHHKELRPGDVLVSNTPLAGGTHLPDITVITPIFDAEGKNIEFYTASRGHHSEVGGILPGSMPASSTKLYEEGAQITSMFLVRDGVFNEAEISKILVDDTGAYPGCSGSRKLSDNLNDLKAQIASNYKGANLVQALIEECGIAEVHFYMNAIKENAAKSVRALLKRTYHQFNGLPLRATDHMDDGTPISVTITINPDDGSAKFDFTGTGLEVLNCFNAPHAITRSATMYVLRCLINEDIPLNEGCLIPITFDIPYGTILNPSGTAAVCAGNPITSQRITDVLIKAFKACAASQGDCNVFSFGFGGKNQETGEVTPGVGFGETVCGGSGAGENWHGTSGVHIHMTNTRITDPEVLEKRYPVILRQFTIRDNSGGLGLYNGGNGVIREYEFLRPLSCSVVSERRVYQPFGMHGGGFGKSGLNTLVEQTKDGERRVNVGGRKDFTVQKGDRFIFETPGGGGWGVQGTSGAKEAMTGPEEQFMLPPGYVNSLQLMQEQSN